MQPTQKAARLISSILIGIGGSYLGTEFVSRALEAFADKDIEIDFFCQM
jgi:glucose-6-phosphate isomerase